MASGGTDALLHNGAIVTLPAVTGLTHRQSYVNIFVAPLIETATVIFVIGVYAPTGAHQGLWLPPSPILFASVPSPSTGYCDMRFF
jgi:hypothetical protein